MAALIASRLVREGNEVTLVEQDSERCAELEDMLDAKIVHGNAASVTALLRAGIADAEMLIAATEFGRDECSGVSGRQCRIESSCQSGPNADSRSRSLAPRYPRVRSRDRPHYPPRIRYLRPYYACSQLSRRLRYHRICARRSPFVWDEHRGR